jgi:hypothetical protein
LDTRETLHQKVGALKIRFPLPKDENATASASLRLRVIHAVEGKKKKRRPRFYFSEPL